MPLRIRHRCSTWAALVLFLHVMPYTASAADVAALEEQAVKQAAALVSPSLVRIETVGGLDRVGQFLTGTGPTTGLVASSDGYIISSSFNFAARPASILVTLPDGRRLPAQQVATDRVKMLTLLKIEADNLTPATAAPPGGFRVGQWTIALGRTFDAAEPSVSVGIVSALNRIWGKAIQTDAKISPVNYGGALVDIEGRVMGLLVPLSPQGKSETAGVEWYDGGIGFAIPLTDVYAAVERLKAGKDLLPGLMGVTMKGHDLYEGQPQIDRIRYGSPAQQAGFKEGDLVVEIDGRPIARTAMMMHVLGNKYAGDVVTMTVRRGASDGPTVTGAMTLLEKLEPYESAYLGVLPVRLPSPPAGGPDESGVTVRFVIPDSPAALAGLARGDKILRCNGGDVTGPAALLDQVSRRRPRDAVRLTIGTAGAVRDLELAAGSLPDSVPAGLRAAPIPPRKGPPPVAPKLGHFTEKMPAHEHEYWAYVPADYNPDYAYALVVWLHPGGDTMEAAMTRAWQTPCDERGVILLAPKAKQISGWNADEAVFVKDAVDEFMARYTIDRSRVVLHGFDSGGRFAYELAFKYRELFRGVSTVAAPLREPPPDNEPDFRLQWHLISGDGDPLHRAVEGSVRALRAMKYPVVQVTIAGGGHQYPPTEQILDLVRWIDALDRI